MSHNCRLWLKILKCQYATVVFQCFHIQGFFQLYCILLRKCVRLYGLRLTRSARRNAIRAVMDLGWRFTLASQTLRVCAPVRLYGLRLTRSARRNAIRAVMDLGCALPSPHKRCAFARQCVYTDSG